MENEKVESANIIKLSVFERLKNFGGTYDNSSIYNNL